MFSRLRQIPKNHSILLLGPRGTGKSTLLAGEFDSANSITFDLLDPKTEDMLQKDPGQLKALVKAQPESTSHIIIDEIQKVPKLLDVVHSLIEKTNKIFVLTGSSARKLKQSGTNLLAGRAFVYNLYPLSCFELGDQFDLNNALRWGTLPKIFKYEDDLQKEEFLRAYTKTYLTEEIWNEHVVRKLSPFRRFLEVASQCNGTVINYSNIARDVGVDDKTVKEYFSILEDTLIGFFLEPYHNSFRKRLIEKPKFYFFDTGVARALSRLLSIPLQGKTADYGNAFEHYILLEIIRLASYFEPDYRFSYVRTVSDNEID